MSAPRSAHTKALKRADKQYQQMQERIDRQAATIDRLVKCNMTYGDALTEIKDKEVVGARYKDMSAAMQKAATDALAEGADILAVKKEQSA